MSYYVSCVLGNCGCVYVQFVLGYCSIVVYEEEEKIYEGAGIGQCIYTKGEGYCEHVAIVCAFQPSRSLFTVWSSDDESFPRLLAH